MMVCEIAVPAPHGPGLVRQLPSVKSNTVPSGASIIMSITSSFPISCCSVVRDLDEPSLLRYFGALEVTATYPSSYSGFGSIICIPIPVIFSIPLVCVRASLNGEIVSLVVL